LAQAWSHSSCTAACYLSHGLHHAILIPLHRPRRHPHRRAYYVILILTSSASYRLGAPPSPPANVERKAEEFILPPNVSSPTLCNRRLHLCRNMIPASNTQRAGLNLNNAIFKNSFHPQACLFVVLLRMPPTEHPSKPHSCLANSCATRTTVCLSTTVVIVTVKANRPYVSRRLFAASACISDPTTSSPEYNRLDIAVPKTRHFADKRGVTAVRDGGQRNAWGWRHRSGVRYRDLNGKNSVRGDVDEGVAAEAALILAAAEVQGEGVQDANGREFHRRGPCELYAHAYRHPHWSASVLCYFLIFFLFLRYCLGVAISGTSQAASQTGISRRDMSFLQQVCRFYPSFHLFVLTLL
jgi:hypothetical protein